MNLREATAAKHKEAESMPFNQRLMGGTLTPEEYINYLRSQLDIFQTIESAFGVPHSDMMRTENVLDDLTELGVIDIAARGEATGRYCAYLRTLDYQTVLPHVYLNYMAVMMGGQLMRDKVPTSGRMYDFGSKENLQKLVSVIRGLKTDESWIDEVNRGYDFIIDILKELDNIKQ